MKTNIIILMSLMMGYLGTAFGQEAGPESIAVCPPGEPAEMIVIAPEDVIASSVETPEADS
ncbi:MAG: hypothetical protein K2J58_00085, partial [Muribaculaceae bacterium]|nr:hypothetical protein [Muribaculaceae bacterium]